MTETLKVPVIQQQRLSFVDDFTTSQTDKITITTKLVDDQNQNANNNNTNTLNVQYPNNLTVTKRPTQNQLQVPNLMERRQSQWNTNKRSLFGRRFSQSMSYGSRKSSQDLMVTKIRYQNTYRIEPDENTRFYAYKVSKVSKSSCLMIKAF